MTLPTDPTPPSPSREEARLRLVCAALQGLYSNAGVVGQPSGYANHAVGVADAALALLYPEPEEEK